MHFSHTQFYRFCSYTTLLQYIAYCIIINELRLLFIYDVIEHVIELCVAYVIIIIMSLYLLLCNYINNFNELYNITMSLIFNVFLKYLFTFIMLLCGVNFYCLIEC